DLSGIEDTQTACVSMPCTALLPPSFVDFIFRRNLAEGVFVTGCCEDDCYHRLGNTWMDERFASTRMPHLRTRGAKDSVRVSWTGPMRLRGLQDQLADYRKQLRSSAQKPVVGEEVVNG
ncbi:MAG: hydrogenase iron-sulfur subunit, partial [Pseudomonadales bacterium]